MIQQLTDQVQGVLVNESDFNDERVTKVIDQILLTDDRFNHLGPGEKLQLSKDAFNRLRRYDVLQPLLDDDRVSEIMINGPHCVFIEQEGRISKSPVTFDSVERLESIIQHIVSTVNRKVNRSHPIADARLLDGSRVNVVMGPLALGGPVMTIRKFPKQALTMSQLVAYGTLSSEVADFLKDLVRRKYNLFISGGTGSGKTTLLNALSAWIPKAERVITIEDSAELQIQGIENMIRLEAREKSASKESALAELIRTSLRMRPDRIIVGEVRGKEALDMLQAMNTGHEGSLSTGHANGMEDMLYRLESMVMSGSDLPAPVVKTLIASSIDIVVQLKRLPDGARKLTEIGEVSRGENGRWTIQPLFKLEEDGTYKLINDLANRDKWRLYGRSC